MPITFDPADLLHHLHLVLRHQFAETVAGAHRASPASADSPDNSEQASS